MDCLVCSLLTSAVAPGEFVGQLWSSQFSHGECSPGLEGGPNHWLGLRDTTSHYCVHTTAHHWLYSPLYTSLGLGVKAFSRDWPNLSWQKNGRRWGAFGLFQGWECPCSLNYKGELRKTGRVHRDNNTRELGELTDDLRSNLTNTLSQTLHLI